MQFYDKFNGHTWYIQSLLDRLYGWMWIRSLWRMQQIISAQIPSYTDLLKAYSAGHVRLLKAIAREEASRKCWRETLSAEIGFMQHIA